LVESVRSPARMLCELVAAGAAVPDDPPDGRRGEMAGEQAGAALGIFCDEPGARPARELTIGAGERRPFRLRELQLVMEHVAEKNGAGLPRAGMDHDVSRRMPGSALEP